MKRLIITGAALALLTCGALAQAAPATPPGVPPAGAPTGAAPSPPPGPGAMADDAAGAPPPGPRGHRPPPPPSRAAHFRLERGDTALDVKCADDEPMKACADIALQMLDKMQSLPAAKP